MTSHLAEWSSLSDSNRNRLRHKCGSIPHGSVWSFLFFPSPLSFLCLFLFVPFNSCSHSYASWISNAYLWSGWMYAACPDSMTDSTATLSSLRQSLLQSSTPIIPLSWKARLLPAKSHGTLVCWHGYNSLLTSHHCSPLIQTPTSPSSIPAE